MKADKEDIKAPLEPEHLYRKRGWHVDVVAVGDGEAGVLQTPAFCSLSSGGAIAGARVP